MLCFDGNGDHKMSQRAISRSHFSLGLTHMAWIAKSRLALLDLQSQLLQKLGFGLPTAVLAAI